MPNELMYSQRLVQLLPEATPGVYDMGAAPIVIPGLMVEQQPEQAFATLRAQGYNVDTCHYIAREHSVISGTLELDYKTIEHILKMALGAAVSDTPSGGTRTIVFQNTLTGPRNAQTYTLEYGTYQVADRCPYALLQSIKLESNRLTGDKVSGNVTFIAQKPVAVGVHMTGAAAQNESFDITTSALGEVSGVFGVSVAGGAVHTFTVTPGMANSDIVSAIEGALVSAGVSSPAAAVTGGFTLGTQAVYSFTYTELHSTFSMQWNGMDGGMQSANIDAETLQNYINTTISAAGGSGAVAVSGSSFNSVGSNYDGSFIITYNTAGINNQANAGLLTCGSPSFSLVNSTPGLNQSGTVHVAVATPANTRVAPSVVGGAGWGVTETQAGSAGTRNVPPKFPVITKNMSGRRSATHASLASASQLDRHLMTSLELNGLVDPVFYFNENAVTYDAHVDGDQQQQIVTIQLSKASADEPALYDAAHGADTGDDNPYGDNQVSTAQWFNTRFVHPDGAHRIDIDTYASVHAVANQQAAGKVWARTFPMAVEQAPDEPYAIQATVVLPS